MIPTRYDIAARRQHRCMRGDWPLPPWLVGRHDAAHGPMPTLGRWKIIDNLRRSLSAPLTLVAPIALAAMVAPGAALRNVTALADLGPKGTSCSRRRSIAPPPRACPPDRGTPSCAVSWHTIRA